MEHTMIYLELILFAIVSSALGMLVGVFIVGWKKRTDKLVKENADDIIEVISNYL